MRSADIPYGKQDINQDDIDSVVSVLKSDYLTQGSHIEDFENAFSDYIGAKHAIAVSNGTAALHLSALALNVQPGQRVITSPLTFAASANCVRYCGGEIQFVDIDPDTLCIDLNRIEDLLKKPSSTNIQGIIPVDFAGQPVDMENVRSIADKYGLWILEDACHAPGGYFIDSHQNAQQCGNGAYADLSIFSFHPVKHITTGEGGMITTNNTETAKTLKRLRTNGITKDPDLLIENHGGWYYELQELGYNYRITDFQCALGLSQLGKADLWLKKRIKIAETYSNAFKDFQELDIPKTIPNTFHAWHLYIIQTSRRKKLYDYLKDNKIYTQVHYIPLHLQPYYKQFGWKKGDCPVAEKYYDRCLSIPMYPSLQKEEQEYVIEKIFAFYNIR